MHRCITTLFGNFKRQADVTRFSNIRNSSPTDAAFLRSPLHDSICKVVSFSISKPLMPALHLATSLLVFWHALIFFPHIVSPFFATACHHPSLTPDPSQLPSELFTLNTFLNRIVRRSKVLLEILHTVLLELSNISRRATTGLSILWSRIGDFGSLWSDVKLQYNTAISALIMVN